MRNKNKSNEDGRFTAAELKESVIRQLADDGLTRGQIADRLRVDPKTLRRALLKYGIDPVRGQPGVAPKPPPVANTLWSVWR